MPLDFFHFEPIKIVKAMYWSFKSRQ